MLSRIVLTKKMIKLRLSAFSVKTSGKLEKYKGAYMYNLFLKFTRELKSSLTPFIPYIKVKSLAPTPFLIPFLLFFEFKE